MMCFESNKIEKQKQFKNIKKYEGIVIRKRLKTTRNVECFLNFKEEKQTPRMHEGEKSMEEVHLVEKIQEHQTKAT